MFLILLVLLISILEIIGIIMFLSDYCSLTVFFTVVILVSLMSALFLRPAGHGDERKKAQTSTRRRFQDAARHGHLIF